ncbi:MAG: hypothetical protein ABW073_05220 [Acidimicrobiia bacterium]
MSPIVVRGGKPAFSCDTRVQLELHDEHRFDSAVHLHDRTQR